LQKVERQAASRVSSFGAISGAVHDRIERFYHRGSEILYPPVDAGRFHANGAPPDDFFLVVSRLIPYKRIDLAVQAFNHLGLPLVVIGDGRERAKLEALAGPNIRFMGRLDDAQTDQYRYRCRALIFPGEDDFGIAPVEAMAAGRPVIAYAAGGALDTVAEGASGLYFREPNADSLAEAVLRFQAMKFDPASIQAHARLFSRERFREKFLEFAG
jgi:glycosyltransferase involved in cell wall biosynthesis